MTILLFNSVASAQSRDLTDYVHVQIDYDAFYFDPRIEEVHFPFDTQWPSDMVKGEIIVEAVRNYENNDVLQSRRSNPIHVTASKSIRKTFQSLPILRIDRMGNEDDVANKNVFGKHYAIYFRDSVYVDLVLRQLRATPGVISASGPFEPVLDMNPDMDPLYDDHQWYLQNGVHSIQAERAWSLFPQFADDILIAIVEPAQTNSYSGTLEFVSHIDLVQNNEDLTYSEPFSSHPISVASVASARSKNNEGLMGVALNARLSYYLFGPEGTNPECEIAANYIRDAGSSGADVINFSWGIPDDIRLIRDAIQHVATNDDVVMVASAGNDDSYVAERYPISYPEVLGVASSNKEGKKYSTSNYGPVVDLGAPGEMIVAATSPSDQDIFPEDGYGLADGTSVAAPIVSGVAALVRAANPSLSRTQVTNLLLSNLQAAPSSLGEGIVYERFGFGVIHKDAIPEGGPSFWCMARHPDG